MMKEFLEFLKEYKVVSLAIAFVMGGASTSLVNALVKDVLMPIIQPLMVVDSWQSAVVHLGPITIAYGAFVAELFNFLILALIVFIIVRKLFKITGEVKK